MEIPAVIRSRTSVSRFLQILRISPRDPGVAFPAFEAGQALELIADRTRCVRKIAGVGYDDRYVYEHEPGGAVAVGRLALWYSIASSPEEAAASGVAEFFVGLHSVAGEPPRFLLEGEIQYGDQPRGDFTVTGRIRDARQVVIAATGTGIAPVVSILKHLHAEALAGRPPQAAVTLFHGHRTVAELGYAGELRGLEQSRAFDFVYLPMLTRPHELPDAGKGRVTEAIRCVLGAGTGVQFPGGHDAGELRRRMSGPSTVILACGSAPMLGDMASIAAGAGIRYEQEGW